MVPDELLLAALGVPLYTKQDEADGNIPWVVGDPVDLDTLAEDLAEDAIEGIIDDATGGLLPDDIISDITDDILADPSEKDGDEGEEGEEGEGEGEGEEGEDEGEEEEEWKFGDPIPELDSFIDDAINDAIDDFAKENDLEDSIDLLDDLIAAGESIDFGEDSTDTDKDEDEDEDIDDERKFGELIDDLEDLFPTDEDSEDKDDEKHDDWSEWDSIPGLHDDEFNDLKEDDDEKDDEKHDEWEWDPKDAEKEWNELHNGDIGDVFPTLYDFQMYTGLEDYQMIALTDAAEAYVSLHKDT